MGARPSRRAVRCGCVSTLSLLWPGAVLEDAARGSSLFLIWRAAKSVSADPYNKPSWGFLNAREDGVKGEPNEGVYLSRCLPRPPPVDLRVRAWTVFTPLGPQLPALRPQATLIND